MPMYYVAHLMKVSAHVYVRSSPNVLLLFRQALGDDELIHRRLVELNVQEQCVKVNN